MMATNREVGSGRGNLIFFNLQNTWKGLANTIPRFINLPNHHQCPLGFFHHISTNTRTGVENLEDPHLSCVPAYILLPCQRAMSRSRNLYQQLLKYSA